MHNLPRAKRKMFRACFSSCHFVRLAYEPRLSHTGGLYPPPFLLLQTFTKRRLKSFIHFSLFISCNCMQVLFIHTSLYLLFFAFPHNAVLVTLAACLSAPHNSF